MPYISSANIACGAHAGNETSMRQTVRLALQHGIAIGAHPGYNDRAHFGRRPLGLPPEEVASQVFQQISLLQQIAQQEAAQITHVKPHGALYNQAANEPELARAIAGAVARADRQLLFYGLANSCMATAAADFGLRFAAEVFADRAYTASGQLVARTETGAVIHDAESCATRVLQMVFDQQVNSINGQLISLKADTICLHGDNPEAIALAQTIYRSLQQHEIKIQAPRL